MKLGRIVVAFALVALAAGIAETAKLRGVAPGVRLTALPLVVGTWQGRDAGPIDADTVKILAADAYLNRTYDSGQEAVGLYVAYYAQQRPGVSIHSPLHCLPGTGWEPLEVTTRTVEAAGAPTGAVRRLLVRKGRDRDVVLYWYAIHGRVIASELLSKVWLLHDGIRFNRSDAALVRIVVPVTGSVEAAEREGLAFARSLMPHVAALWR
jgi:EpsI family protein